MRLLLLLSALLFWHCQPNPYRDGEALYKSQCANCHMDKGTGLSGLIPTLVQSDYLQTHRATLPCALRYGLRDTIVVNGKTFAEQ
ncbi:MAG TPA: cytochrome c, partial [Saprospiraceae bacterium]|nr:cytochrome c [Saprospiraceae bacterium]